MATAWRMHHNIKRIIHVDDPINCCDPISHGLTGRMGLQLRPDQALRADADPVDADAVWVHPPWVLDGPAIVLIQNNCYRFIWNPK